MATYVISDIHGNLSILKKLLEKIDFKFNGEDELYLLGDYVDWGKESIDTILYVIDLSEKYSFIHPLLGNHDLMFYNQLKEVKKNPNFRDYNWLDYNGGKETYSQFLNLPKEIQEKIYVFLDKLPYRAETTVNGKKYLMAHACPVDEFKYDEAKSEKQNEYILSDLRETATWNRVLNKIPSVILFYDEKNEYENFICGHTITTNLDKDKGHYTIVKKEKNYIDIDCGAKILGYTKYAEEKYARLAALRLDDLEEFYEK